MWMTKDEWDSVLSTNLDGFYNVTRAVLFSMLRVRRGRIVAVSSASGASVRSDMTMSGREVDCVPRARWAVKCQ